MRMGAAGNSSEPNGNGKSGAALELCTFANHSQSYPCHLNDPPTRPTAFGWSDERCVRRFVSICRIMRKQSVALLPHHIGTRRRQSCCALQSLRLACLSPFLAAPHSHRRPGHLAAWVSAESTLPFPCSLPDVPLHQQDLQQHLQVQQRAHGPGNRRGDLQVPGWPSRQLHQRSRAGGALGAIAQRRPGAPLPLQALGDAPAAGFASPPA